MGIIRQLKKTAKIYLQKNFTVKEAVQVPILKSNMLDNRFALITGGTSGIGLSISREFLNCGASVVITGRSKERVDKALDEFKKGGGMFDDRVFGVVMDNSNVNDIERGFKDITELAQHRNRQIDILVNNAATLNWTQFGKMTEDKYDTVVDTNLKGTYFLSQEVSNYMKDRNIKGNILNIASSSSLRPAVSPYTISKWGIRGLTIGLAKILTPYGITVNGLAPGPTATPMLIGDSNNLNHPDTPTGRYIAPEEIANMAAILVSDMGKMIIGDIVYMTGGCGVITVDDMRYS